MMTISATCAVRLEKLPAVRNASRVSGWSASPRHRADEHQRPSAASATPQVASRRLGDGAAAGGGEQRLDHAGLARWLSRRGRPARARAPVASWTISSSRRACAPSSSPTTRPWRSTRMRCASRSTSGRSDDATRTATPRSRELVEDAVDLLARADVDAARGLVEQEHLAAAARATCRAPPSAGCRPRAWRRRRRASPRMRSSSMRRAGQRASAIASTSPTRAHRAHDLAPTRATGAPGSPRRSCPSTRPRALAVLGHERDPGAIAVARRVAGAPRARRSRTRPVIPAARAAEERRRGAPSGPSPSRRRARRPRRGAPRATRRRRRSGRAQLAARVATPSRAARAGPHARASASRASRRARREGAPASTVRPTISRTTSSGVVSRGDERAAGAPVAQHGDAIAEREDLVHAVRDVDAGRARVAERAQPAHEPVAPRAR